MGYVEGIVAQRGKEFAQHSGLFGMTGYLLLSGINFLVEHESIRYNEVHYGYSINYSRRSYRWRNIVGAIAKLLMPGKDPGGFIVTILLGIAGAFIATYLGQAIGWYKAGQPAGWIMSIVGAMILLLLYRLLFKRKQ